MGVPPVGVPPVDPTAGGGEISDLLPLALGLAVVALGWLSGRSINGSARSMDQAQEFDEAGRQAA